MMNNDEQDPLRLSAVLPEVYEELRKAARRYMGKERAGQTLQATALVNEAYLKLANEKEHSWKNRAHFCAIAAHAMREILIERARARTAAKRGGSCVRITLDERVRARDQAAFDILALNEALERLSALDPQLVRIVELRFFGGLSIEEVAETLGNSPATVKRGWSMAKSWLKREMENPSGS